MGVVTEEFGADLQHALQLVQALEELVAEYKLREAIMQREVASLRQLSKDRTL